MLKLFVLFPNGHRPNDMSVSDLEAFFVPKDMKISDLLDKLELRGSVLVSDGVQLKDASRTLSDYNIQNMQQLKVYTENELPAPGAPAPLGSAGRLPTTKQSSDIEAAMDALQAEPLPVDEPNEVDD